MDQIHDGSKSKGKTKLPNTLQLHLLYVEFTLILGYHDRKSYVGRQCPSKDSEKGKKPQRSTSDSKSTSSKQGKRLLAY